MKNKPIHVLFVCMGNYCRSPTAEVIFFDLVEKANLIDHFYIDSAGTHGIFAGAAPDPRAQAIAKQRGLKMQHIISRQITLTDFHQFDYIVAMDRSNLEHLRSICPSSFQDKLALLLSYSKEPQTLDVPDPYSGGEQGFVQVYDLIVSGAQGLLTKIMTEHHL